MIWSKIFMLVYLLCLQQCRDLQPYLQAFICVRHGQGRYAKFDMSWCFCCGRWFMDFNRFKILLLFTQKSGVIELVSFLAFFYACHSASWLYKADVYRKRKDVWNYAVLVRCNAWTILHKLHNSVYTDCNHNCIRTYFNCNYNYYSCSGRIY
mgnify:CR=1 FL=1